jgi:hypothetical protein
MARDVVSERELQARVDELGILRHAERLKVICGPERAIRVLETTLQEIRSPHLLSDLWIGH